MSNEIIEKNARWYMESSPRDRATIKRSIYSWGDLSQTQKDNLWDAIMRKYFSLCVIENKNW